MDLDGWVRHRAMVMAASDVIPPSELRPPPHVVLSADANFRAGGGAPSSELPGLSRFSAKVRNAQYQMIRPVRKSQHYMVSTAHMASPT